jgi:TolB-like protein
MEDKAEAEGAGLTIAVADFSGQDKELGRFLADTLLTDLAQSDRLHLVERSEIRQALSELKLQSTGLVEPQQVKKIGKMLGADRLIVGSYLVRENQLIVNARLLDVHTGKVTQGDAANVTGQRDSVLPLVHRLAHLFHKRVTGSDFVMANEQDDGAKPADQPATVVPDSRDDAAPNPQDPGAADRNSAANDTPSTTDNAPAAGVGSVNYGAPNTVVTEQDLAGVTRQIGGPSGTYFFTPERPSAPVTRLRALAVLVKVLAPTPSVVSYRSAPLSHLTPDAGSLPFWGRLYVASAVEHGLWPANRVVHGAEPATWAFVRAIVARAPRRHRSVTVLVAQARQDVSQRVRPSVALNIVREEEDRTGYSGLVIDAHDLPVQRAMSVRILDEDGRVVYPVHGHIPDIDWLEDNGLVSYHYNGSDLPRAGRKPLYVRALRVSGDDFVVSSESADRILEENRRTQFLWKWNVCILQDEGQ